MTPVSHGKPCAGNPHARFDEGASASEKPRRNALLLKYERELKFINDCIIKRNRSLYCVGLKTVIEFRNNQLTVFVSNAKNNDYIGDVRENYDFCTWRAAWRISREGEILLASGDMLSEDEFNLRLRDFNLGRLESIEMISDCDVRIRFGSCYAINYITVHSDADSTLDVFTPRGHVIAFSPAYGWQIGESEKPWRGEYVKSVEEYMAECTTIP